MICGVGVVGLLCVMNRDFSGHEDKIAMHLTYTHP